MQIQAGKLLCDQAGTRVGSEILTNWTFFSHESALSCSKTVLLCDQAGTRVGSEILANWTFFSHEPALSCSKTAKQQKLACKIAMMQNVLLML